MVCHEFIVQWIFNCLTDVSCSHKKNVIDFLDQLSSFYENNFLPMSSEASGSTPTFIDKVAEIAVANGLSSKTYSTALSDFSAENLRKHFNKVYGFASDLCNLLKIK